MESVTSVSFKPRVVQRWRRFTARLGTRFDWHIRGILLWLLQRPMLRWVPLPYPSVGSVKMWIEQSESMGKNGTLPKRHYRRAVDRGHFTIQNLQDGVFLRNRLGLEMAFLEDQIMCMGMKAARSAKGMQSRIRAEAMVEAKKQAVVAKTAGRQQLAVRELIGPRGGLPTLRGDLLKLAALLNVELDEKATVEQIKKAVRPMVKLMMDGKEFEKDPPAPATPVKPRTQAAMIGDSPQPLSPGISSAGSMGSQEVQNMGVNIMHAVNQMMMNQEQKFEGMFTQVMSPHMMSMQSQASQAAVWEQAPVLQGPPEDAEMGADQYSKEEVAQMNADY